MHIAYPYHIDGRGRTASHFESATGTASVGGSVERSAFGTTVGLDFRRGTQWSDDGRSTSEWSGDLTVKRSL